MGDQASLVPSPRPPRARERQLLKHKQTPVPRRHLRAPPMPVECLLDSCTVTALIDPVWDGFWEAVRGLGKAPVRATQRWSWREGGAFAAPDLHQHAVPSVIIPCAGMLRVIGRGSADLHPGDMLLIEAGCWHQHCEVRGDCAAIEIGRVGSQTDVIMRWGRRKRWGLAADLSLFDLAVETARVGRSPELIGAALLRARLTGFDWGHGAVALMAGTMWNHLHQGITVSEILAASGHGPRQARRLFGDRFGHSADEELRRQRRGMMLPRFDGVVV